MKNKEEFAAFVDKCLTIALIIEPKQTKDCFDYVRIHSDGSVDVYFSYYDDYDCVEIGLDEINSQDLDSLKTTYEELRKQRELEEKQRQQERSQQYEMEQKEKRRIEFLKLKKEFNDL